MTKKEIETKAFGIVRSEKQYIGVTDDEILQEIVNATDDDLLSFIEEWNNAQCG